MRFRLRTLMILVAIVALPIGSGVLYQRARKYRERAILSSLAEENLLYSAAHQLENADLMIKEAQDVRRSAGVNLSERTESEQKARRWEDLAAYMRRGAELCH